jgi:hypothetical protein
MEQKNISLLDSLKLLFLNQDDVYNSLFSREIQFINNYSYLIEDCIYKQLLERDFLKYKKILNKPREKIINKSHIFIKNENIICNKNDICGSIVKYNKIYFECNIIIVYGANYVCISISSVIIDKLLKLKQNKYSLLECLFFENNGPHIYTIIPNTVQNYKQFLLDYYSKQKGKQKGKEKEKEIEKEMQKENHKYISYNIYCSWYYIKKYSYNTIKLFLNTEKQKNLENSIVK